MAIPPIIMNNPLFKLFRTEQAGAANKAKPQQETRDPAAPSDVVEISNAAQARLNGIHELANDEALEVAEDTRDILGRVPHTLGLQAGFGGA